MITFNCNVFFLLRVQKLFIQHSLRNSLHSDLVHLAFIYWLSLEFGSVNLEFGWVNLTLPAPLQAEDTLGVRYVQPEQQALMKRATDHCTVCAASSL